MRLVFFVSLTFGLIAGCGPQYPDNSNHSGAENSDCKDCHVDGEHEDAPELPSNHFENGKLDWDNCKHCHHED